MHTSGVTFESRVSFAQDVSIVRGKGKVVPVFNRAPRHEDVSSA